MAFQSTGMDTANHEEKETKQGQIAQDWTLSNSSIERASLGRKSQLEHMCDSRLLCHGSGSLLNFSPRTHRTHESFGIWEPKP